MDGKEEWRERKKLEKLKNYMDFFLRSFLVSRGYELIYFIFFCLYLKSGRTGSQLEPPSIENF
jgi:hypothetical protein